MKFQILASTVRGHLGAADLERAVSREVFLRKCHELGLTEGSWPGRELKGYPQMERRDQMAP